MQTLDMKETIDQLAKTNSVHWYGHVLRKDKNNFLRRALDLRVRDKENLTESSCRTKRKTFD